MTIAEAKEQLPIGGLYTIGTGKVIWELTGFWEGGEIYARFRKPDAHWITTSAALWRIKEVRS